ncbi:N-acetylmuramoyl-L-alanine amidase [Chlorobium sp. N1]|nr:N-acetylmuramoyl-L-alanine amidase [Chlorobium sp. N1]
METKQKRALSVLLDNGHGSDTPGKRSPEWGDMEQLFEWEFNRAITKRVAAGLERLGIECELVVPEEEDISITERIVRVNTRARRASSDGRAAILVSVHANASPDPLRPGRGWECWTSRGHTKSDELAEMLYREAARYLWGFLRRKDRRDGDSDKETNAFSLLSRTICPAVLTENLFMDNPEECRFLLGESGREAVARLHLQAIVEYNRRFGINHI